MGKKFTKPDVAIIPEEYSSKEDYLLYLRHMFAYESAKNIIPKDSFVLEVGSGEGYGTHFLSAYVRRIIGLDIDKDTIKHASRKYKRSNVCFKSYDGLKLPYKDEAFDAVVSFQVIEHIENDKEFISDILRVLKNNGILLITTPNRIYRLKRGQKPWNKYHLREYYPQQLAKLLKSQFREVKLWGVKGRKEVQKIETERARSASRVVTADPYNLRRFIPPLLMAKAISIYHSVIGKHESPKAEFIKKYSVNDYFIIKKNVNESLDLFGFCQK